MEQNRGIKVATIKLLAIIGFFAVTAIIVWALIQGVRIFPHAFSSLASIAESIQGYERQQLEIKLDKNIVNSGETFALTWTDMSGNGTYHFGYSCTDGLSLRIRTSEDALREISCTEDLELPKEANGLFVTATTLSQRFSDLTFSVRFDAEKGDNHITQSQVTIVNATLAIKATEVAAVPTPTPEVAQVNATIVLPTPPVAPTVSVPVVSTTQPAATIISILPQSNPSGFIDLKMSFGAVGTMSGNTFTPVSAYDDDARGGLRFEVKNIGTKRSDTWTYRVELPEGTYTSDAQAPLEPNERVVFTMSFDFPESHQNSITLKGSIDEKKDIDSKNDSFSWSVKVTE